MNKIQIVEESDGDSQEFFEDPVDTLPEPDGSVDSTSTKKRGRPKIPEHWTRILYFDHTTPPEPNAYVLGPDILLNRALPFIGPTLQKRHWKPFFEKK
jgi:hypothetical protein